MSSGYSFDAESVKRISRGIRRIEGMPDPVQGFGSAPVSGPGGAQVRTPATLPANYDGTQPLFGKLIDRDRDGNVVELADAYILGANNNRLEESTEYLGRMERVYTGPSGSAVLYRVQSVPAENGFFARCHPWRIQEVFTEEQNGAGSGSFWQLIYVSRFSFFYDNGNWDYWANDVDEDRAFFYPPWPADSLPLFSLSDSTLDLNFNLPNGTISQSDKIKREACYARVASFVSVIGYPSYLDFFQKSKLYFKTPYDQKIYLNQSVYSGNQAWGYQAFSFNIGLPFTVSGVHKVSAYDGRRFAILQDRARDKYGTLFPYYIWFEDPFGLVKNDASWSRLKRVLITPTSYAGLSSSSGVAGVNNWALVSPMSGPAYIVTNSSDQSLLTTTPVV